MRPSGLKFLFLSCREEDVVEDEPIAGGVFEEVQDGFGIAYFVLIILGIMTSVEGEGALADIAVNILNFICSRHFTQDNDTLFDLVFKE